MGEQARNYRIINPANLDDLANQINRVFAMMADRVDSQEGFRGTPTFRATVDMKANKVSNAADATEDQDAMVLGQVGDQITDMVTTILYKGFEWVGGRVNVKPKTGGGIEVETTGVSVDWTLDPNKGQNITRVEVQFDTATTALGDITGLLASVTAGRTYWFKAGLFFDCDAGGLTGHKYGIGGDATATSIIYQINSIDNATGLFVINSRQTAFGGAGAGETTAINGSTEIEGVMTAATTGSLEPQFATNVLTGATSSVLVGSFFMCQQI